LFVDKRKVLCVETKKCEHLLVDGYGGMGDAVICCKCGLCKYPEAIPIEYEKARATGRIIKTEDARWPYLSSKALERRKERECLA